MTKTLIGHDVEDWAALIGWWQSWFLYGTHFILWSWGIIRKPLIYIITYPRLHSENISIIFNHLVIWLWSFVWFWQTAWKKCGTDVWHGLFRFLKKIVNTTYSLFVSQTFASATSIASSHMCISWYISIASSTWFYKTNIDTCFTNV